ncbi:MAG: RHS repeat-associated core domain-containing protein, partial [Kiritimatiellae bacterium]|nr:RHS repeat-associated core domain-containing protein [Kiritimatiellia bacterium]
ARWQYDAWGNVLGEEVAVPALASLRYRFQCREWSAATGLVNFRMRWYDAETGRWLSKDPIGLSGGLNLYVLCDDDALNYVDSYGCGKAGIVIKVGK